MCKHPELAGKWVSNPRNQCLEFYDEHGRPTYEISIPELTSSAEILDYVMQVHEKVWATPEVFRACVEALDYTLDGIQQHYCSFGSSKHVIGELLERRKIGWRIFPKPRPRPSDESDRTNLPGFRIVSAKELVDMVDREERQWVEHCESLCRRLFGEETAP